MTLRYPSRVPLQGQTFGKAPAVQDKLKKTKTRKKALSHKVLWQADSNTIKDGQAVLDFQGLSSSVQSAHPFGIFPLIPSRCFKQKGTFQFSVYYFEVSHADLKIDNLSLLVKHSPCVHVLSCVLSHEPRECPSQMMPTYNVQSTSQNTICRLPLLRKTNMLEYITSKTGEALCGSKKYPVVIIYCDIPVFISVCYKLVITLNAPLLLNKLHGDINSSFLTSHLKVQIWASQVNKVYS